MSHSFLNISIRPLLWKLFSAEAGFLKNLGCNFVKWVHKSLVSQVMIYSEVYIKDVTVLSNS